MPEENKKTLQKKLQHYSAESIRWHAITEIAVGVIKAKAEAEASKFDKLVKETKEQLEEDNSDKS